jgi:hypothetical protein
LGGFRSKIEVGYLLCAYEKPVRLALIGISEIRNFFAHNLEIKEFTGPNSKLDESFAKLSLHTIYSTYPSPFWDGPSEFDVESVSDRRSQFIINLKLVLIFLMRDMKRHEIYSNEPKALPPPPPRGTPLPEFEP